MDGGEYRYPEWDLQLADVRPNWSLVREIEVKSTDTGTQFCERVQQEHGQEMRKIRSIFQMLKDNPTLLGNVVWKMVIGWSLTAGWMPESSAKWDKHRRPIYTPDFSTIIEIPQSHFWLIYPQVPTRLPRMRFRS